jgi:putative transposase
VFVLVFLHVGTRRAFITPATTNPAEAWVRDQTESYLRHAKREKLPVQMPFHDRDSKFHATVDADLERAGIEVIETAFRAPNTNAYVERFIQTIQQECLNHFVILGGRHFDYLVREWLEHYHAERPHQAKENEPLIKPSCRRRAKERAPLDEQIVNLSQVRCSQRLGGLLKSYRRRAA